MRIGLKRKKLFKVNKCQKKCPKNSKFLVQEYIKVLGLLKNLKTFLNKGSESKKNYMEDLKSINKNIKGGESS